MNDQQSPAASPTAQALPLDVAEASAVAARVLDEVEKAVVGKRAQLSQLLAGIVAKGHVLIEDLPGLGKTLAARSLAQALGLQFTRAQFTPDLLPSDLTGSYLFNQNSGEFTFREGPIFTGLLLADEINRTPPKTQSALLEAMQEHQVTVEGHTFVLPQPFHVVATANPIEHEGTYPLPEAQLDRFLLRLSFGHPTPDEEWEVLARRIARKSEDQTVEGVLDAHGLLRLQASAEEVHVSDEVGHYAVALCNATRAHDHTLVGASPRGSLALITVARAVALIAGRDYVIPEDVKALAIPALAHRVSVRPELWLNEITAESVVRSCLEQVPVPDAAQR